MGNIYQFKPEDAEDFVRFIGIKSRHRGDQLEIMYCPYCRTTADKWTFGISMKTGQFECKRSSCGAKGNMITLSRDFDFSLGKETDAYYRTVDYSRKQFRSFHDKHLESKPAAVEYLMSRGISEEIVREYEITTRPDADNVICFPFKDENGKTVFIKYRNTTYKKGDKGSKEWCEENCKPILFGMNHCNLSEKTIVITEGQIDSLSVTMAGVKNAVSVPTGCNGFTWVPYCWDFMDHFTQIIVMGDCEKGHITLADEISKRWGLKVRICRQEDYRGCKDANEILQKYGFPGILKCIENAEAPDNSSIKSMAKVKNVDIMKIPAISTGMQQLDEVLSGGFRMGQLAVLTGKRGEGKSTLASMWGVQALNQNYNCFFYSGELMDFYFRNWMDCQVSGKDERTPTERDMLNVWYENKAFIYEETEEGESLLKTIEAAIVQKNCQFILIDNLMTAIDDDLSVDLYRSQSKLVGDLAKMAKKYEVFILLIAHPRKEYTQSLNNDSVSGSSNITDKADIVLAYGKPDPKEDGDPDHRRLQVIKNRLTGKLRDKEKAIWLVYDSHGSRRVAENTSDFRNLNFNWNTGGDFYSADNMEDIPF